MNQSEQQSTIDWTAHIKAQQGSGLSAKAYCASHTLNYDQFGYYKRKLSDARSRAPRKTKSPGFAAVDVDSSQKTTAPLSLVLPSGIRIEGIDDGNLSACLGLLGRLS
jgi:hypothetical protein